MLLLLALAAGSVPARAEEQPFAQMYTPYLDERGESELELSSQASHGQNGGAGPQWYNRLEFEHAFSDRLSGALYLNAFQSGSLRAPLIFDGPSVEAIYRLSAPGPRAVDAAGYLEVRENGDETELEPRLLLAHHGRRGVLAVNAIGEFEFLREAETGGEAERSVRLAFGATRTLGKGWSAGLEGWVEQSFAEAGAEGGAGPRALFFGPTLAFSAGGVRGTAGWQPQVAGAPKSRNGLDLDDFPRSQLRLMLGIEL
jgi:hypothetical protein